MIIAHGDTVPVIEIIINLLIKLWHKSISLADFGNSLFTSWDRGANWVFFFSFKFSKMYVVNLGHGILNYILIINPSNHKCLWRNIQKALKQQLIKITMYYPHEYIIVMSLDYLRVVLNSTYSLYCPLELWSFTYLLSISCQETLSILDVVRIFIALDIMGKMKYGRLKNTYFSLPFKIN